MITRRAVKAPPDQGGWNIFITWSGAASVGNPIAFVGHQANGEKGWFGWPTDEVHEKLRDKWAAAGSLEEQKAVAREMQKHDWDFVPHVWLGQWASPVAYRKNLTRRAGDPGDHSVLEYREGVSSALSPLPACGERSRAQRAGNRGLADARASSRSPHPARSFAGSPASPRARGAG